MKFAVMSLESFARESGRLAGFSDRQYNLGTWECVDVSKSNTHLQSRQTAESRENHTIVLYQQLPSADKSPRKIRKICLLPKFRFHITAT